MKIPLYDPSFRDAHLRDILSRIASVLLWIGYFWICKDIFRLLPDPLGSMVPGSPLMDPAITVKVLKLMLTLCGIAYVISVFFAAWRAIVERHLRTLQTKPALLDKNQVCQIFGIEEHQLKLIQSSKTVEIDVTDEGKIELKDARGSR